MFSFMFAELKKSNRWKVPVYEKRAALELKNHCTKADVHRIRSWLISNHHSNQSKRSLSWKCVSKLLYKTSRYSFRKESGVDFSISKSSSSTHYSNTGYLHKQFAGCPVSPRCLWADSRSYHSSFAPKAHSSLGHKWVGAEISSDTRAHNAYYVCFMIELWTGVKCKWLTRATEQSVDARSDVISNFSIPCN